METKKENERNCKSCRFCIKVQTSTIGEWTGQCRKNPPSPVVIPQRGDIIVTAAFPMVQEKDYCFSFEGSMLTNIKG